MFSTVSTVAQLAQTMLTHKPALVDITLYAVDMSLTGILPKHIVLVICQDRLVGGILGYHELVVVQFANKITVVEVCPSVDKWFLMIGLLHHVKEFQERVAKLLVDLSHYQGNVFWETVGDNSKMAYVYLKATEGGTNVDSKYKQNIDLAHRYGLKVGSYHFYRARIPQQTQLKNFMAQCRPGDQDLLPMIDVETKSGLETESTRPLI